MKCYQHNSREHGRHFDQIYSRGVALPVYPGADWPHGRLDITRWDGLAGLKRGPLGSIINQKNLLMNNLLMNNRST